MPGSWGEAGAPADLLPKGSSFHLQFPLLLNGVYQSFQAAITKHHRLGGL